MTKVIAAGERGHAQSEGECLDFLQQNQNQMTTGKALLGVAAGIAAGAVLGAVLARRGNGKKNISRKGEALIKALMNVLRRNLKN